MQPDVVEAAEAVLRMSRGDLIYYLYLAFAVGLIVGALVVNRGRKAAREDIERALEKL